MSNRKLPNMWYRLNLTGPNEEVWSLFDKFNNKIAEVWVDGAQIFSATISNNTWFGRDETDIISAKRNAEEALGLPICHNFLEGNLI